MEVKKRRIEGEGREGGEGKEQGCAPWRFGVHFWRYAFGVFYEFEKFAFGAPRENFGAQPGKEGKEDENEEY